MNDFLPSADLDDPIGAGLRSAHASLAESLGSAYRYPPEMSPFASIGVSPTQPDWQALADLTGPDGGVALFMTPGFAPAEGWRLLRRIQLTQMVHTGDGFSSASSVEIRELTAADVPEMMRLTTATEPGPFAEGTIRFGGYVGIFDGESLVAMAGRRMSPPGFVEISAVCTDPAYRGRGYARAVMAEVFRTIHAAGSGAFLHVAHGNPARRLYEELGFVARREFDVLVIEPVASAS